MLRHDWKQGTPSLCKPSAHSSTLSLIAGYHSATEIPQVDPHSTFAFRTLGVYIFPSGSQKRQFEI